MVLQPGNSETPQSGFKFDEDIILDELFDYILPTYDQHYGKEEIQASEFISDAGHGTGFFMGNLFKYGKRYGKKGATPAEWRKDLIKIAHYIVLQIWEHDKKYGR